MLKPPMSGLRSMTTSCNHLTPSEPAISIEPKTWSIPFSSTCGASQPRLSLLHFAAFVKGAAFHVFLRMRWLMWQLHRCPCAQVVGWSLAFPRRNQTIKRCSWCSVCLYACEWWIRIPAPLYGLPNFPYHSSFKDGTGKDFAKIGPNISAKLTTTTMRWIHPWNHPLCGKARASIRIRFPSQWPVAICFLTAIPFNGMVQGLRGNINRTPSIFLWHMGACFGMFALNQAMVHHTCVA